MIRADFACLSTKCKTPEGEASVYELPVSASRCPMCGSKRVRRLFNAINVIGTRDVQPDPDFRLTSSSRAVIKDTLMRPGFDTYEKNTPQGQGPLTSYSPASLPQEVQAQIGMPTAVLRGRLGATPARPMTHAERQMAFRQEKGMDPSSTLYRVQGKIPTTIVAGG